MRPCYYFCYYFQPFPQGARGTEPLQHCALHRHRGRARRQRAHQTRIRLVHSSHLYANIII